MPYARTPLIAAMGLIGVALAGAWTQTVAPATIAVLDFDYVDTSDEEEDQRDLHEARLRAFGAALRQDLGAGRAYRVVTLNCGPVLCSAGRMTPQALFEAAKKADARFILYGGVHKMSTLVQWARAQMVDVEKNLLIDDRTLTFRGDDDEAWRRAEQYLARRIAESANWGRAK